MGSKLRSGRCDTLGLVRVGLKSWYTVYMTADIELKKKHETKVKGVHLLSFCDIRTETARKLEKAIEEASALRLFLLKNERELVRRALYDNATDQQISDIHRDTGVKLHRQWGEYNYRLGFLHKRFLKRQRLIENITATVGRSVFMQRLTGTTTYTGIVNYGALGSSATAAAIGNTQLGTEVYRKALSSGTYSSNIGYLENFYTSAETSGTYQEYGFFIDGSGSANTGQLFNRFTTTTVKASTESLNVQSTVTCSDA